MKKKKISISAITLFFLIVISIGGTLAWFINYGTNQIEGTEVTVSAGNVMELSLDGVNYSSTLLMDDFAAKQLNMQDVTGDGVTFLRPVLGETQVAADGKDLSESKHIITVAQPDLNSTWLTAKSTAECDEQGTNYADADYISFTIYFRASTQMEVYLTSTSFVEPKNENGNYSPYAAKENEFSRDWIAAASRIAFVDNNKTVRMLWAPLSDRKLFYDVTGERKGYKITQIAEHTPKVGEFYYYYLDETEQAYQQCNYRFFNQVSNTANNAVGYTNTPIYTKIQSSTAAKSQNERPVAELTLNSETGFYEGSVTVNIWIEGCDNEARRALAGGNIHFAFVFAGFEIEKQAETGE